MKIKEVKQKAGSYFIYEVTFTPNWLEKLLGVKEKTKEYRQTESSYLVGGQNIYVDKDGYRTGNGSWIAEEIDRYKRKF